ncbi:hypothetical protein ONZ45_g15858 [Pleurotus djamor]|nr:hypothetical protein ONZ45_g15858 [Pleurotus djamor]
MWKNIIFSVFLAAFGASPAVASLYPTSPVSSSIWTAGEYARVTWKNDARSPNLEEVGPISISLYTANDTFVRTLARNVSPQKRIQRVHVPDDLEYQDTKYFLRFTSSRPRQTTYTTNFQILPVPNPKQAAAFADSNEQNLLTLSAPPTTTSGTSSSVSQTTSTEVALAAGTTVHASPLPGSTHTINENYSNSDGRVDMEMLKFRLVFVIWPALIGISMSL